MKRKFIKRIPGCPDFRRQVYVIPEDYSKRYQDAGIVDSDQQIVLFHLTQFGGFKMKKIPRNMHFEEDFREKWCIEKRSSGGLGYKASDKFLEKFADIPIQPLERIWRNGAVVRTEMIRSGYSEEETKQISDFMKRLNTFYSDVRVNLDMPSSGINAEDRINLARIHTIPFLVVKPLAGGRMFHPESSYQRISSPLRKRLTINGEKTAELDLRAATLQFLDKVLEKKGLEQINYTILSNPDPYFYFLNRINDPSNLARDGWIKMDRDSVKNLVYTSIFSSKKEEGSNLSYKLRNLGSSATHKEFVGLFPEFFRSLEALRESTMGTPLHMIINREESGYARSVLETGCMGERIPILPLHDSFITTASHVHDLERVMNDTAKRLYGRELLYKRKY
jgi:hypothetical protein